MLLTVDEKSVALGSIDSLSVTVTLRSFSFVRTMSAMPLPYWLLSSSTATFLALSVVARYVAAAGPWLLSVPTARCQNFQPLVPSDGFVADTVMLGRPACSKMGFATVVSAEKAGPIRATMALLETAFCARAGACAGSPCESKSTSPILQVGFAVWNWLMASLIPSRSLVPRAPLAPVMAPKNPMVALQPPPPEVPPAATLELFFELLQAAMIVAETAMSATARRNDLRSGIHCLPWESVRSDASGTA